VSRYLIDTDWLIDVLHGQEQAVHALETLAPGGLAVSHITYAELYEGAYYARNRDRDLQALRDLLDGKDLLPVSIDVLERFAVLRGALPRQHRQQLGDMDLLIAATALTHSLTLLTGNLRDFELVPGLALYAAGTAS
jgi:tRNA(fMet)-specific endonuclease VapC